MRRGPRGADGPRGPQAARPSDQSAAFALRRRHRACLPPGQMSGGLLLPRAVTVAFQTDKPLAVYGPLAATVEAHGSDGRSAYHDLLSQPAWLPLLDVARHTRPVQNAPAALSP